MLPLGAFLSQTRSEARSAGFRESEFEFVDLELDRVRNPLLETVWVEQSLLVVTSKSVVVLAWEDRPGRGKFFARKELLYRFDTQTIVDVHVNIDADYLYLVLRWVLARC